MTFQDEYEKILEKYANKNSLLHAVHGSNYYTAEIAKLWKNNGIYDIEEKNAIALLYYKEYCSKFICSNCPQLNLFCFGMEFDVHGKK